MEIERKRAEVAASARTNAKDLRTLLSDFRELYKVYFKATHTTGKPEWEPDFIKDRETSL